MASPAGLPPGPGITWVDGVSFGTLVPSRLHLLGHPWPSLRHQEIPIALTLTDLQASHWD